MARENIKTTINEIVDYWSRRVDECGLSVDWSEADTHCWRCGCEKNLERCHIIPASMGGKDEPENLVLLCKRCHAEGPNVTDPEIMWDWIRANGVPFYNTYWSLAGRREYKFIYRRSFKEDLAMILSQSDIVDSEKKFKEEINRILDEVTDEASNHFGQPYFNSATMAGIYRMALKKLANSLNVEFPSKEDEGQRTPPWWLEV